MHKHECCVTLNGVRTSLSDPLRERRNSAGRDCGAGKQTVERIGREYPTLVTLESIISQVAGQVLWISDLTDDDMKPLSVAIHCILFIYGCRTARGMKREEKRRDATRYRGGCGVWKTARRYSIVVIARGGRPNHANNQMSRQRYKTEMSQQFFPPPLFTKIISMFFTSRRGKQVRENAPEFSSIR